MITLDEALQRLQGFAPLGAESVPLRDALGRVTASAIESPVDLPLGDQSAMDGYALRSADTATASRDAPVELRLGHELHTGQPPGELGEPNTAVRIGTGGWLPAGADAIVAQEDATRSGQRLTLSAPVLAGRHLRRRGETLRRGQQLLQAGTRLGPGALGLLAQCGVDLLYFVRRPRVAILTTGSELRPPGRQLKPGQAFECNGALVAAAVALEGGEVVATEHCPDDAAATRQAVDRLAADSDLLITTGGVSVGDADHVVAAAEAGGFTQLFWRVAQKPGKPLLLARRDGAVLLGIPGNPASVFTVTGLHLAVLLRQLGGRDATPNWLAGRLHTPINADARRVRLLRVRLQPQTADSAPILEPLPRQGSHELIGAETVDGFARIDPCHDGLSAGTAVRWIALPSRT